MSGKVGDVAQAFSALQLTRDTLVAQLEREPAWRALRQLEARDGSGEAMEVVSASDLHARLASRLDTAVPGWRTLAGLETAIAALRSVPIADLPTPAAEGEPVKMPAPVDAAGSQLKPSDIQPAQLLSQRLSPTVASPPGSSVAARNSSLAEAITAIQALAVGPGSAPNGAPTPASMAAPMDPLDASAEVVLARIRSITGERRQPAIGDTRRPAGNDRGVPAAALQSTSGPRSFSPSAPAARRAAPSFSPQPPVVVPARTSSTESGTPPQPRPNAQMPNASARTGGPEETVRRVSALEQELDHLIVPSAAPPGAMMDVGQSVAGGPSPAFRENESDDFLSSEADVEIIALSEGSALAEDHINAATRGEEPVIVAPTSVSDLTRPASREISQVVGNEPFAAYQGIIDEASVEIIVFDESSSQQSSIHEPSGRLGRPHSRSRHDRDE